MEWPKKNKRQETSVDKDVKTREHLYSTGGAIKFGIASMENSMDVP